jgi:hypothetical protein
MGVHGDAYGCPMSCPVAEERGEPLLDEAKKQGIGIETIAKVESD